MLRQERAYCLQMKLSSGKIDKRKVLYFTFLLSLFFSFQVYSKPIEVQAIASTDLPIQKSDVMDDPAIWVNQKTSSESLILGTNKREPYGGLYVYTLKGKLKEKLLVGPINNVDVRPGFLFKKGKIDIAVASHRDKKKLAFFAIHPSDGKVSFVGFSSNSFDRMPYGLCLQKKDDDFYAIVTFNGGGAEKWQFWESHGQIQTKKIKTYPIATQAEGCVTKDQEDTLFIAEEWKGIWVFKDNEPGLIMAKVGEHNLISDLEGLALYQGKYLIASSQGNSSYGVFAAEAPFSYLGTFKITASETQEGTEETDGIDVTSANLGGTYSKGLFVAHDNRTSKGGGSNFKLVPWIHIAEKLGLE